jgi:hypothetical protein
VTGRCDSFNGRFGFIKEWGCGRLTRFFFLASAVIGEVRSGDQVDYWLADDDRRPGELIAVQVQSRERRLL